MRPHSPVWSVHFRGRAALALAASLPAAGCTILAGIQEGHFGSLADSGAPPADATVDAMGDSVTEASLDATRDGTPTGDSAADAPSAPARALCSMVGNSILAIDESANYGGDGSTAPGFIPGVWLARTTTTDEVFLFTQLAGDASRFLEYQVDFAKRTVGQGLSWGGDGPSIHLVAVESMPAAANSVINAALTTYPGVVTGAAPGQHIQIVPLRSFFGGPIWANALTGPTLGARIESGTFFIAADGKSAEWLVAGQATSMTRFAIWAGEDSTADAGFVPPSLGRSNTTKYVVQDAPFFDMGGAVHVFLSGVDPDGGASVYTLPQDLAQEAGAILSGTVIPGSTNGRVVSARPSATYPSQALVLALVPDATGTQQRAYGARVDPAQLASLAVGSPPLATNAVLGSDVVPVAGQSGIGWMDDETALFGQGPVGTGLYLVWLGPDGHAVFSDPSGMPLLDDGLGATAAAVQFGEHLGEMGATLYVAWIETVDANGDQAIKAVKLSCTPVSP